MIDGVTIRELGFVDLAQVTKIHLAAFPESALSKLGAEAVRRYYKWLLEGPHDAERLGAFVGRELVGFCFGGVFRGAMSGFLSNNRLYLYSRVMTHPWIVTNPIVRDRLSLAVRLLRRIRKTRSITIEPAASKSAKPFGILAIAVSPNFQGLGAGKLLMQKAEDVAKAGGFHEMILTVRPSNQQAIRFYESLRWVRVQNHGDWEGGMEKLLVESKGPANVRRIPQSTFDLGK